MLENTHGSCGRRCRSCSRIVVAAAAASLMLPSSQHGGGVDAFMMSPKLVPATAAAVGRWSLETKTAVVLNLAARRPRRAAVRMVSAAAVDGVASTKEDEEGKDGVGLSLGERVRADFPILDQACTRYARF